MRVLFRLLLMPDGTRKRLAVMSRNCAGSITVSSCVCETPDTVYVAEPADWQRACDFFTTIEQSGRRDVLY